LPTIILGRPPELRRRRVVAMWADAKESMGTAEFSAATVRSPPES
jgi:hypothetical protein